MDGLTHLQSPGDTNGTLTPPMSPKSTPGPFSPGSEGRTPTSSEPNTPSKGSIGPFSDPRKIRPSPSLHRRLRLTRCHPSQISRIHRRCGEVQRMEKPEALPTGQKVERATSTGPQRSAPARDTSKWDAVLRPEDAQAQGQGRARPGRRRRVHRGDRGGARRGTPRGAPRLPGHRIERQLCHRQISRVDRRRVWCLPERVHLHGRDCVRVAGAHR